EDLDHVLAVQARREPRLPQELRSAVLTLRMRRLDQLQRDLGMQRQVLGAPHRAHAAAAQLAGEPVLAGENLTLPAQNVPRRAIELPEAVTLTSALDSRLSTSSVMPA